MVLEKMQDQFTKYEIARILGARSLQLAMDAPMLLKIDNEQLEEINYDVLKIAEMEFVSGVLPITVKRPFPKKTEERIKKVDKDASEKSEKAEDKKIEEKEHEEEEEIKEEGEIMELAKPEDEIDEEDTEPEEGAEGI